MWPLKEHYPLPLVDDITANCAGATMFSTLDAEKAFYQIQLDEESSKLLTFNTPFGRYRYLRMPMGIKSAPEVYQQIMEQVFEGLPGVKVIMDDIIIHGRNTAEHDTRLRAVLQHSQDSNLRLKKSKCHIQQFHGHVFSKDGLRTYPEKVRAIVKMPRPTDTAGVQRLLGMVNYVSKFIPKPVRPHHTVENITTSGCSVTLGKNSRKLVSKQSKNRLPLLQC